MEDSMQIEDSTQASTAPFAVEGSRPPRNAKKGAVDATARLPGSSPFPISKVSKIIKADKDVQMCQKEAVFLISCAAEHFLKRITDAAYTRARMDKRGKSVLYKDLAAICSAEDGMPSEYFYLEDIVPKQTQTTIKSRAAVKSSTSTGPDLNKPAADEAL